METNITELLPSLWAVKVPDEHDRLRIEEYRSGYALVFFIHSAGDLYIELPKGPKYTLIGEAGKVDGQTAMDLLGGPQEIQGAIPLLVWDNHEHPFSSNPAEAFCDTAIESLQSLLISKWCDPSNTVLIKVEAI